MELGGHGVAVSVLTYARQELVVLCRFWGCLGGVSGGQGLHNARNKGGIEELRELRMDRQQASGSAL